jgi:hypothetical protein
MESFLTILKSLPVVREIGKGVSTFIKYIGNRFDRWKTKGDIDRALKKNNRANAARNLDDEFRGQ